MAIRQKVELRFEKGEAARFISHHDLMRALQRALRRAGLAVRLTGGYNPRLRVVFPMALEAGVASLDEAAEIELTEWTPLTELHDRLTRCLPPGLLLRSLQELPPTRKGRPPVRIRYRVHLAEQAIRLTPEAVAGLHTAATLPFTRRTRTAQGVRERAADLKANLVDAILEAGGDLVLDLRPQSQGLARPLEYLSLLTGRPAEELRLVRVSKLQMELAPPVPPRELPPAPGPPGPRPPRG